MKLHCLHETAKSVLNHYSSHLFKSIFFMCSHFKYFCLNYCWFNKINSLSCSSISSSIHHSFFFFYVSNNLSSMLCRMRQTIIHCIAYLYCFWLRMMNRKFVKLCQRFFKISNACSISIRRRDSFLLNCLFAEQFFFEALYDVIMKLVFKYVESLNKYSSMKK